MCVCFIWQPELTKSKNKIISKRYEKMIKYILHRCSFLKTSFILFRDPHAENLQVNGYEQVTSSHILFVLNIHLS